MAGVVADRVVVELEAKLDRYNANVLNAQRSFERAMGKMSTDAKRTEAQMRASLGSIRGVLLATTATLGAAFGVSSLIRLADGYTRFTNQLRVAGLEGANLTHIQNELFAIAQRQGVPLEALGTLYGRVAQSAGELGANQQQLIQFTSGVAAAIRIQGGSAADAQGALLQLSQALGGSIVRAEEFNSINEGARPILAAVARGMEEYRGSVARLRNDVIQGKVTSREFFEGFLRGSAQLEEQASRANLTISASFQILSNAFSKYIGETDAAHGATQRISQALQILANNLDTIIPALVQIAGLMGAVWLGRFAAGMVAAAGATGAVSAAIFALQARAIGAATTMEALAFAGRAAGVSMLAAFGGPVGLAVTALAVGMYYLATATDAATDSVNRNIEAAGEGAERYRTLFNEAKRAREANERLGNASATTGAGGLNTMATSANNLEAALRRMGLTAQWATFQAARATLADAQTRLSQARTRAADADAEVARTARMGGRAGLEMRSGAAALRQGSQNELQAAIAFAHDAAAAGRESAGELNVGLHPPTASGGAPPAAAAGRKGRHGTDPDDITRRFENETAALEQQIRDATAQLVGSRQARVAAELAGIETDRARAEREIEGNDNYSAARKAELKALNDRVAGIRRDVVNAEETDAVRADQLRMAQASIDGETELAQINNQMADTNADRRRSALELLRLSQARERLEIDAALQARGISEVERQILESRRRQLDAIQEATTQQINRETEGPWERYMRDLRRTSGQMNEDYERIAVEGLQNLNDGLVDAIMGAKSLGEVFHNVANQIIADILRIVIQQLLIKPIAELLGGGSGGGGGLFGGSGGSGGGILNFVGSLFGGGGGNLGTGGVIGMASGGHVSAGRLIRVNETGIEGFQPAQSGKIIPLGRMNKASEGGAGAGAPAIVRLSVGPSEYFDVRVHSISGNVAVDTVRRAAPELTDLAVQETFRRADRPTM